MRSRGTVASCQTSTSSVESLPVASEGTAVHRRVSASLFEPEPQSRRPCLRVCPSPRGGFTLVEMLIVIGIIILAITMAVPAIRALSGSKSLSVGQNTIAAYLTRARAEAIGLQQTEGVLFYIDPNTSRIALAQVEGTPAQPTDPQGVLFLDLVPDHDTLLLPPGVGLRTFKDLPPPGGGIDYYPQYRYLGFNFNSTSSPALKGYGNNTTPLGGVILFDGNGRVTTVQYGFRFVNGGILTGIGQLAFGANATLPPNWPATNSQLLRSQIGFVLFDHDTFSSFQTSLAMTPTDGNPTGNQTQQDGWMDTNTSPLLVNRYDGTLTASE